jgi:hypothetical protein
MAEFFRTYYMAMVPQFAQARRTKHENLSGATDWTRETTGLTASTPQRANVKSTTPTRVALRRRTIGISSTRKDISL